MTSSCLFGSFWAEWGLDLRAQGARSLDGLIGIVEMVTVGPMGHDGCVREFGLVIL